MRLPTLVSVFLQVSDFCDQMSHTDLTWVAFLPFGLYLWRMNSIVSVPACVFHPCDRRPSLLHIEFFHTVVSFFTMSLYPPNFPVVSQCMWFYVGSM